MTKILFVIPARSGSKGIKDKNIQFCGEETLLRRSIKICKSLSLFSDIFVSTDSKKYLEHVEDLIHNPPFLRPKYLSGDLVGDIEVLINSLHICENFFQTNYSCVVMIQPTCPLRQTKHILETIKAVVEEDYDAAITCQKVDKKYHPLKSLKLTDSGYLENYINHKEEIIARQQLDNTYIRNGASYSITPKQLCIGRNFFKCKSKLILTEAMISIDNHEELKHCESLILNNENYKI